MTDSLKDQLENNLECENILECLYGLKQLDKKCYKLLLNSDKPLSATEISNNVNRDNSTVHRSLNRLRENQLISRTKKSLDSRGYEYLFEANNPDNVSQDMRNLIENWNEMINDLVDEFEDKYS